VRTTLVSALSLSCLLALAMAPAAPASPPRDSVAKAATAQTTITATPKEVYDAVRQALSEWKIRKESFEEGYIKTEWIERTRGDATYRTRLTADWSVDGYQVLLAVKSEKQLKQGELRPTIGGPSASWMDVSGDYDMARAVVTSVERALGAEEPELKVGQRPPTSSRPIEVYDCFVSPQSAARIVDLKAQRRDLVTEIKAMDEKILAAAYDGKMTELQPEMDTLKARKAEMEDRVTAIDKEILQLVIAD
jgi:hypothetical protein